MADQNSSDAYRAQQEASDERGTSARLEPSGGALSDSEPDVLLDVPTVKVEEINLQVEDLRARVSLQAEVLDLVKLNVGADVGLGRVELDIKGVEAQALLKVRLDNVAAILDRVLTTIDRNPQILEHVTRGLESTTRQIGGGAAKALEETGAGAGKAVEETGAGAGRAVEETGAGAGRAVEETGAGAGRAVEETGAGAGRAVEDTGAGAGRAVEETGAGAGRAVEDTGGGVGSETQSESHRRERETARSGSGSTHRAGRAARRQPRAGRARQADRRRPTRRSESDHEHRQS
jgi:hypothetical protein